MKGKWIVFAITGMANLTAAFSINSMTLALPLLEKEFGATQSAVSWLAIVYSLIPCCTLLIFGRTAEIFGYKRQFKIGFVFFGSVSLAAPLFAANIGLLIFFRCLQGLGYSIMISITQAVVSRAFPEAERGKALGVNSVFVSAGLAAGPTVGGALLTFFSWRSLFYFNVPFCIAGLWAASVFLPDDAPYARGGGRMDIISVNLRLFVNRSFSLANSVCLISYLVQQLVIYLTPFYLINILLLQPGGAGLVMLSSPALMMLFSPLGGAWADKKGPGAPAVSGISLIGAGCLTMGLLGGTAALPAAVAALALMGSGNGLSVPAVNTSIFDAAPREHMGAASGVLATMRNLGQALGVMCGSAISAWRRPAYKLLPAQRAYLYAQRDAYFFGAAMAAVALILFILPRRNARTALK